MCFDDGEGAAELIPSFSNYYVKVDCSANFVFKFEWVDVSNIVIGSPKCLYFLNLYCLAKAAYSWNQDQAHRTFCTVNLNSYSAVLMRHYPRGYVLQFFKMRIVLGFPAFLYFLSSNLGKFYSVKGPRNSHSEFFRAYFSLDAEKSLASIKGTKVRTREDACIEKASRSQRCTRSG